MNTQLFLLFLFVALLILPSFIQKAKDKVYNGNGFSLTYPYNWEIAVENDVAHLFPTDNNGSITVACYTDIDVPDEEMPSFLMGIYQLNATDTKLFRMPTGERTDFFFEHTKGGLQWFTKAIHFNKKIYLLAVNCEASKWNASKPLFMKVINSFRLS